MGSDRAEGTSSSDASGNPSAIVFPGHTYEPLVQKLRDRGFLDADTDGVPFLLERVSYRHLQPYLAAVKQRDAEGAMVKTAHDLLTLDRRFQAIVFKYIGIFETQLRAQYAHWMEVECGPLSLYEPRNFLREKEWRGSIERLNKEVARRREPAVKRMLAENEGRLPVWEAVEFASLGTVSKLFGNTSTKPVTQQVTSFFGCGKAELSSWTRTITAARNIMAHFDPYIVRSEIPSTPLAIRGVVLPNRDPFYIVMLLAKLLSSPHAFDDMNLVYAFRLWLDLRDFLDGTAAEAPELLDIAGFPIDWEDEFCAATGGALRFYKDVAEHPEEYFGEEMEETREC